MIDLGEKQKSRCSPLMRGKKIVTCLAIISSSSRKAYVRTSVTLPSCLLDWQNLSRCEVVCFLIRVDLS